MVKSLGAVLVESIAEASTATHVIASDGKVSLRRTPKLMVALCCTKNIVSLDWLTESASANELLPCENYLISDKKAEKNYGFNMKDTLKTIESRLEDGKRLLEGWQVYFCTGVAGNRAPDAKESRLMIEAAGGEWVTSCAKAKVADFKKLLIITSDPEPPKQVKVKAVSGAIENGASKRTTKWLFDAMMKQECDL